MAWVQIFKILEIVSLLAAYWSACQIRLK